MPPGPIIIVIGSLSIQLSMSGRCVWASMKSFAAKPPSPFTSMTSALPSGDSACPPSESSTGYAAGDMANMPSASFANSFLFATRRFWSNSAFCSAVIFSGSTAPPGPAKRITTMPPPASEGGRSISSITCPPLNPLFR